MRFITEDDLRLAYKEHAFSVYEAKAGERLTRRPDPGWEGISRFRMDT